ncbi:hypothetical protein LTR78_006278 [Recurvomyces mirabilis]|uniref:Uncharacterized protein n=1 Tax=Recurvomyces mirabilis TaxID=574656 RepID=A0AAE0WL58_9PEZI|nr:hypothetical protein LTR78_006278 [Recurvomyces mirabilis]KAK5152167.1 hypothetical protein LTS14_008542 [Recurvomyces mirabilis]
MDSFGSTNTNDNYWKARGGREDKTRMVARLRGAGYGVSKHASSDALYNMTLRIDTHQICYEQCSSAELLKFKKDHNVSMTYSDMQLKDPRAMRMALETVLYAVDREIKFERFRGLPAEQRNSIYESAMAHFADQLITPSVPPLARVCKQLRSEVLPLFYAGHSFLMEYQFSRTTGEYRGSGNLSSFLMALANNDGLRHIRRLTVKVIAWQGVLHGPRRHFSSQFDVALCGAEGERSSCELDHGQRRGLALSAAMARKLQYLLDQIDHRDDGSALTMLDLRAFRQVGEEEILIQSTHDMYFVLT